MLTNIKLTEESRVYTASVDNENICWRETWRLYGKWKKRKTPHINVFSELSGNRNTEKLIREGRKHWWRGFVENDLTDIK